MSESLFDTQFAMNIDSWERGDLVTCLTKLTQMGYDGIEVTNGTYVSFGDRVQILREIIDDVGIKLVSYVLKLDFDEVAENHTLLDHFSRLADFVHKLKGKYVIVEQGLPCTWQTDVEEQLNHFEKVITDFAGICADNNVELVFHPTHDSFIRTPEMLDRVVELIYPLGCRICFDVCSFMSMGVHPIQFLKKYFDAVRVIHLNDMKILKGKKAWMINPPNQTLLGDGKVDLKAVWLFLQAMEYKGWIIIDNPPKTSLEEGMDRVTKYLNSNLEIYLTNTI